MALRITNVQVIICANRSRYLCGLIKEMTQDTIKPNSGKRTMLCAIFNPSER